MPLLGWQPFSGANAEGRAVVDLAPLQSLIETIESETGFRAANYEISVVPHVLVSGRADGREVNDGHSSQLTFVYNKTTITPSAMSTPGQDRPLVERRVETNRLDAGLFAIDVAQARPLSILLAGLSLGGIAAFASVVFLGLGKDEASKVLTRHRLKVVAVDHFEEETIQRIRVSSLEDLARLAEAGQGFIFSEIRQGTELLFVADGGVLYEYVNEPGTEA